jgi:hypothetical protein|tara:strand:- start:234 stop:791 length:558 start_codon:yes stop_codon:yes gene_type:complete
MSFNFVAGKPAHPINLTPIMSGNFTGDIDGDGSDLENVSHIGQTNAVNHHIVFFDGSTTGLAGNEMNIRGDSRFQFDRGSNIFTANSGMVHGRVSISSHHEVAVSDYFIGCNHTASITITLPFASNLSSGQTFTIKDESGVANTFNINVVRQGSDLIDGETNFTIDSPYGAVNLYSNGNNKFFLF